MFIHIGDRKTISGKKCVGIFNCETIKLSDDNGWITKQAGVDDRTAVVDINGRVLFSGVSPYTVIKRQSLDNDIIWRKQG